MSVRKLALVVAALFASAVGFANAETIDQQQPLINATAGFLGVGGDSDQKLSQTFKVGVDGKLIALDLPMACSGGSAVIEIRQQMSGRPEGSVLRRITLGSGDLPFSYAGFQRIYLPAGLRVSAGAALAFTVEQVGDGNCSYATAPAGDTYPRGQGFFDARPNPPGWLSFKETLDVFKDLPFKTVMEDEDDRRAGRCIAAAADPDTGLPIELPISRDVPACRCFEDAGALEFRCAILHPDFFALRRIPLPLTPGKPYKEIWDFSPVTQLDGPVRLTLEGGGHRKPSYRDLGYKAQPGGKETVVFKGIAPKVGVETPAIARFEYDMQDASNEHLKAFGLDTIIDVHNYK